MEFKAKNQFASIINACVSHELRNPLNSIIAKNIEKAALYEKILNHFFEFEPKLGETAAFKDCKKILEDLENGRVIQQNSAQLMNFIIQDMLDFAQIKNDKFRHNYKEFNIREAIEKVMCI